MPQIDRIDRIRTFRYSSPGRLEAMEAAKKCEEATGKPHYLERRLTSSGLECLHVTDRMPYLGEWYDSDGIRHG